MDRRTLIKGIAGGTAYALVGCKKRFSTSQSQLRVSPLPSGLKVRKNWLKMDSNEKNLFIKGVELMVADSGPLGWAMQANLHDAQTGEPQGITSCPHGNPFFLPWHRAYITNFEDIMIAKLQAYCNGDNPEKLTMPSNFGLPYWAWEESNGIPSEFLTNKNLAPHLITDTSQQRRGNQSLNDNYDQFASSVKRYIDGELNNTSFLGTTEWFQHNEQTHTWWTSEFENWHGYVHVEIGGSMLSPSTTARDPIFWLHHCNVDRIWSLWMTSTAQRPRNIPVVPAIISELGGGTTPAAERDWLSSSIGPFYDATGKQVSYTVKDTVISVAKGFGFQYDTETVRLEDSIFEPPYGLESLAVPNAVQEEPTGLGLAGKGAKTQSNLQSKANQSTGTVQVNQKDGSFQLETESLRSSLASTKLNVSDVNLKVSGLPGPDTVNSGQGIRIIVEQGSKQIGNLPTNDFGKLHGNHKGMKFSQLLQVKPDLDSGTPLKVKLENTAKYSQYSTKDIKLELIIDVES